MCGIVGIIGCAAPDIKTYIATMSEAVAHRGPDAAGVKVWPRVGQRQTAFAHRRLSILDLSEAGRQPMTTPDERYSIVFNGEIYNYRSLRKRLLEDGVRFSTRSDTEVLLQLYARFGAACLRLLEGMFAFAVRDDEQGEVFAARDRLGIKPFYYYSGDGPLLFSSEIRALLASGLVPRAIDVVSLNSYLSFGAVQEPRTIIQNVRTLPPAHYISITPQGKVKEIAQYWKLPVRKFDGDRAEALALVRARLEESVRSHLVSDVPLGAFLSGGIDSGSIVALMSRYATGRVETFTVCFKEPKFSEHISARRVAKRWGTSHTEIFLSENDLLKSLPQAISDIDQPTIDGINTWVISQAAKKAGLTVVLSGLGGDELFGGYPSFQRVPRALRYTAPMNLLNPASRTRIAGFLVKVMSDSIRAQKLAAALSGERNILTSYASVRGLFSRAARMSLMDRKAHEYFSDDIDYHLPNETLALLEGSGRNGDIFNRISQYELSLYTANMLLRDTDAMSMAHALEVRVPLLDHKLLECVFALPGAVKAGRHPKSLLVEALGEDLPSEIISQKKKGFTLPFERWLHTALKPLVEGVLKDAAALTRVGLNPAAVAHVLNRFATVSKSTSWSRVWGLVVLVDWCRRNFVEMVI